MPESASGTGPGTGTGTDADTDAGSGRPWDIAAAGAAVALLAAAAVVGTHLERAYHTAGVNWPPLMATWMPHLGPGTPAAVLLVLAVAARGPGLARRLGWRPLLALAWAAASAVTWSLALVDGWRAGVQGRLTTPLEYLSAVGRVRDVGGALRDFAGHILITQPAPWPAHVSGHPPGALLTFVALDRIGLGGGGWAAALCVTAGSSAVVAVLVTLRALGSAGAARRAAPFLVLAPAAVWVGVSADGYFAGVAAWGVALLALSAAGATRVPAPAVAAAGGVLLGFAGYLSYGLVLVWAVAGAVLAAARTVRPLVPALVGALAVAGAFTAAGFCWFEGYDLLVRRYYEGIASVRPYGYWVWANLAATVAGAGLATVAGVRRAVVRAAARRLGPLVLLVLAALAAVLAADLSGLSKGEVERIWLPFVLWLLPAAALLPARDHRPWLLAQGLLALLVNHLLRTLW